MSEGTSMRLDRLLANMGYGTRSEVKKAIRGGAVMRNGQVDKDAASKVIPIKDEIYWNGSKVEYKQHQYWMMHKPAGVISATMDDRHQTVLDVMKPIDRTPSLFPVGRLDKDTEGLVLLTNDGALAHALLTPKRHVDKCYHATVHEHRPYGLSREQIPTMDQAVAMFQAGIQLDLQTKTLPAVLTWLEQLDDNMWLTEVIIQEGKYHQVKRMFQAVHRRVHYLKRLSMGPLTLDASLATGEYRPLTADELKSLQLHVEINIE